VLLFHAFDGPEVYLGWEPQYVLIKRTDTADEIWNIFDSMRGIVTQENDSRLIANSDADEYSGADRFDLTSTGFRPRNNQSETNASGGTYVWMAIRRPDGYVAKPRTATELFAVDTGGTRTTTPNYDSGFPVDFALLKNYNAVTSWDAATRLTGTKYLKPDSNVDIDNFNDYTFDSNTGWAKDNGHGTMQSWMWRRHAGFEVQRYSGTGVTTDRAHNMNAVPEMIWVKATSHNYDWAVGHIGINGGTNPWTAAEYLILNTAAAETVGNQYAKPPTSTHWSTSTGGLTNDTSSEYIAMLFSSVSGISKCGYYDGSNDNLTISTGFSPRFLIIKRTTGSSSWFVLDTAIGWGSGSDNYLKLSGTSAQASANLGEPTSTGFIVNSGFNSVNNLNEKYIYYAHA
jgi:hypothetical protein